MCASFHSSLAATEARPPFFGRESLIQSWDGLCGRCCGAGVCAGGFGGQGCVFASDGGGGEVAVDPLADGSERRSSGVGGDTEADLRLDHERAPDGLHVKQRALGPAVPL